MPSIDTSADGEEMEIVCRAICDEHITEPLEGCTEVFGKLITVWHTTEERHGCESRYVLYDNDLHARWAPQRS